MATDHYDTISIGSGEAGKFICMTRAAKLGLRTLLVEDKWFGGSCPNIACIPSKTHLYSAEIVHTANKYVQTGLLRGGGEMGVNLLVAGDRRKAIVQGMTELHENLFQAHKTALLWGHAKLVGDGKTVEVEMSDGSGKKNLTADHIVINTGSKALIDDTPGLKQARPLTHVELLEIDHVPEHLIILGGGYIGIEFAQAFRRFGAQVSVIERNARVLKSEDEDMSAPLIEVLESEGVAFHTSVTISSISGTSGKHVTLTGTKNKTTFEISGTHLLVATGRTPNTSSIGLENVGVQLTPKGHVKVDAHLQTDIPGVFAAGDCAGTPHFTHMSYDDYRVITEYILNKGKGENIRSTVNRQIPHTLFTSPSLAHVGLTEQSARAQNIPYRIAKLPPGLFLRSRTMDAAHVSFAKALISTTDDTILGYTALAPRADELLPVVQLAMQEGLGYQKIAGLTITHPSMNEGNMLLFDGVPPREA